MDTQAFIKAEFMHREKEVPVPELADFFGKDKKPVWVVRGLKGPELARAQEAAGGQRMENVKALITALSGDGDKAAELRKVMGLSDDETPADVSFRIQALVAGSVSPVITDANRDTVVKLAEFFPGTFLNLTNIIKNLTGQGAELGKPKRSGKTPA